MADQTSPKEISKLELDRPRVEITYAEAFATVSSILTGCGCDDDVAAEVANHLIDSNLSGVESHGIMRVLQYAQQFESGYMDPKGRAGITTIGAMFNAIDGGGGIGIPAMRLAFEQAFEETRKKGITCLPVQNVGHTGRHGAFAEKAAQQGMLTLLIGGGNRQTWRQVAPHGGSKAMLPTNPLVCRHSGRQTVLLCWILRHRKLPAAGFMPPSQQGHCCPRAVSLIGMATPAARHRIILTVGPFCLLVNIRVMRWR